MSGESCSGWYDECHVNSKRNQLGEDLARMLKGGVIMDVVTAKQAKLAERAGACSVMALERVPSDIRKEGGVARMSDPQLIREIQDAVSIPVMAKVRIGHAAEAKILEELGVDFIDESEVLTPADPFDHIDKRKFKIPFVCGATNLGEALRRVQEGAAMIRTKGEAGTGNVIEAVRHLKLIKREIAELKKMKPEELKAYASAERVEVALVKRVREEGRLPVVTFVAGGVATPADAALLMDIGAEGVFVGSGIFKSKDPRRFAEAIVKATVHYKDLKVVTKVSTGLGAAMPGLEISGLPIKMQERGW
ncbi:pyridoxal 5'-phosphate synthase lyase subunit PdxS [Candidatus Peregrinibacteria bacterium]|nr:pyridoxal 5'-phosphate synthase lyase subunit PdxS [Candidatus Peregrinibacteria bacterium]